MTGACYTFLVNLIENFRAIDKECQVLLCDLDFGSDYSRKEFLKVGREYKRLRDEVKQNLEDLYETGLIPYWEYKEYKKL